MIIIEIAGHLGADPETRVTPDGQKVTSFRVATNIRRKGADETVWWRVTVWGDRFDKLMPYLKKGSAVIVHGSLSGKPEIYTDKNGVQNVSLDIPCRHDQFQPLWRRRRQEPTRAGQSSLFFLWFIQPRSR